MKDTSGMCTLEVGTVTQAMNIQELLSRYAIPSKIIKTDSSSRRGCIYAISYACLQSNNVSTILSNAKINLRSNREK